MKDLTEKLLEERRKKFEKNVQEALLLLKDKLPNRNKVVELCLDCCDRFYGGRAINGDFTMTRFASEIRIKKSTLFEWLRRKEIILDKLPESKRNDSDNFYQLMMKTIRRTDSPTTVEKLYDDLKKTPDSQLRFDKYILHARSINYNAARAMSLAGVKSESLDEMMDICTDIIKNIKESKKQISKLKLS